MHWLTLAQHLVDDGVDVGDVDLAVAGDVGRGGALAQHHINGRVDITDVHLTVASEVATRRSAEACSFVQHIAIKEGETKPSINYYLHLAIPKLLGSTQANRRNDKFLNHLDYVVSPVLSPCVCAELRSGTLE